MSAADSRSFRAALARKPAFAAWFGLGAALAVEAAGAAGCDLVLIDQQHGFGGQDVLLAGLMAARAGGTPAAVRVAWNEPALISRALDAGAQAIVCPMVNSVADAQALVDAAKYPPLGGRSWGPYRAGMMIDGDPLVEANTWSLTFAQIETGEALEEADAILAVEGIDGVVVGPNDLAISVRGDREIDAPDMVDNVQKIQAACARHGKLSWIFANTVAYGRARRDEGWDILTVSTEQRLLSQAFADTRAALFAD